MKSKYHYRIVKKSGKWWIERGIQTWYGRRAWKWIWKDYSKQWDAWSKNNFKWPLLYSFDSKEQALIQLDEIVSADESPGFYEEIIGVDVVDA